MIPGPPGIDRPAPLEPWSRLRAGIGYVTNDRFRKKVPAATGPPGYFCERPIPRPAEISPLSIRRWYPHSGFVQTHAL